MWEHVCVLLQQVNEWHRKYDRGMSNLVSAARSGRPHTVNRPDISTGVEHMIQENWQVISDKLVEELKISQD